MRKVPSALAIFGGREIFTFGSFEKPPGTPSLATATLIPWSSAFLSPADASEVDSEFTSRPNAGPMKTGPVKAAHAHRMARPVALEMLVFMSVDPVRCFGVSTVRERGPRRRTRDRDRDCTPGC